MDENLKKEIVARFDALPKDIQNVILSSDFPEKIKKVREKFGLSEEGEADLSNESTFVMIGLEHPNDFIENVRKALSLPPEKAKAVALEVNETIFKQIRESLMKIHQDDTPAPEEIINKREFPSQFSAVRGRVETLESAGNKVGGRGAPENLPTGNAPDIWERDEKKNYELRSMKYEGKIADDKSRITNNLGHITNKPQNVKPTETPIEQKILETVSPVREPAGGIKPGARVGETHPAANREAFSNGVKAPPPQAPPKGLPQAPRKMFENKAAAYEGAFSTERNALSEERNKPQTHTIEMPQGLPTPPPPPKEVASGEKEKKYELRSMNYEKKEASPQMPTHSSPQSPQIPKPEVLASTPPPTPHEGKRGYNADPYREPIQ